MQLILETCDSAEPEGFLLEMGVISNLKRSVKRQTMSFEISTLSLCSLQSSQGHYTRPGKGQASQIPKFGSMLSLAVQSGNTEDVRDSHCSQSDPSHFANEGIRMAESECLTSKNTSIRMEGLNREKTNDFIVENLSMSLGLESYLGQSGNPDGWRGSCSFLDIDVGITTSEIQVLFKTLLKNFLSLLWGLLLKVIMYYFILRKGVPLMNPYLLLLYENIKYACVKGSFSTIIMWLW